MLGEGTYAKVIKGYDLLTGEAVAIKRMIVKDKDGHGMPYYIVREIFFLKHTHPHMITLLH